LPRARATRNLPGVRPFEYRPDQDRLTAVAATVTQDTNRSSAFDALKEALTDKYGKPTSSDAVTDHNTFSDAIVTKTVQWRLKSSMVALEWIEAESAGAVVVRYAGRKQDPTL
jgi:hypothetical protein